MTTYFSCQVNGGLTSELLQFSAIFKLGRSLGFEYFYTPMTGRRSSSTIHDFLGVNQYLKTKYDRDFDKSVVFADIAIGKYQGTFVELQNYVKKRAMEERSQAKSSQIMVIRISFGPVSNKLIAPEKANTKSAKKRKSLFSTINTSVTEMPDDLGFRSIYDNARKYKPWRSLYEPGHLKTLVHIRQGDTAVIESPWGTYIPTWGLGRLAPQEYQSRNSIQSSQLDVDDFHNFLKKMNEGLGAYKFSTVVSSDGYTRGFERVYKNAELLGLNESQIAKLKIHQETYDETTFQEIAGAHNTTSIVGESEENLFDFVHSAMESDIIIFGTQQRLIPKLVMLYQNSCPPPILIQIYKSEKKPMSHLWLGWDAKKLPLILVDLNNDLDSAITKINDAIRYRAIVG